MRTQFLYAGLLGMLAGGLVVGAGCDDNHTGQPGDPGGPVKLIRLLIQDSLPSGPRAMIVDLLDTPGTPLSGAVACDDTLNPCLVAFTAESNASENQPDFSCDPVMHVCNDPLAPTATVSVTPPKAFPPATGEYGGDQIRLVFNKLINAKVENVTADPTKPAGSNDSYALVPGVIDLLNSSGAVVPTVQYWDPQGGPYVTSDVILSPFGPALVMKPRNPLLTSMTYTIRVDTSQVTDRKGNGMGDQNGNPLSGMYTKTFTTEALYPLKHTPNVVSTTKTPKVAVDSVIQIKFNSTVDAKSLTFTMPVAPATIIRAYPEVNTKKACAQNPTIVDLVNTSDGTTPIDWPEGDYAIQYTIKNGIIGAGGAVTPGSDTFPNADNPIKTLKWTVVAEGTATDDDNNPMAKTGKADNPYSIANHPTPEQCM